MDERIELPFTNTHGTYFDREGRRAERPSELWQPSMTIDDVGVFSILQFGALVPPLSPWKEITRFIPGFSYEGTRLVGPNKIEPAQSAYGLNEEEQADELERRLDGVIQRLLGERRDPVVLFSGGVDSGLIASRLAVMGYQDALLLNFAFSDDDPEAQLAEAMAKKLGMQYDRVRPGERPLSEVLEAPGKHYPLPFGDHSVVPTLNLAYAVMERLAGENRVLIDGSAADGAFGRSFKIPIWKRVQRVPRIVRKAASAVYGQALWQRTGRLEYLFRVMRRSVEMPLLAAILAQNGLAGVFFDASRREQVETMMADWMRGIVGDSDAHQIVAAEIGMTCEVFVQKVDPILTAEGYEAVYPFLDQELLEIAMASVTEWANDAPKLALKRSLARHVPREMVYRPKSGLVEKRPQVFYDAKYQEHLRAATEDSAPLSFIVHKKPILKAADLLARGEMLPTQTMNSLWSITFADRWYRTAGA